MKNPLLTRDYPDPDPCKEIGVRYIDVCCTLVVGEIICFLHDSSHMMKPNRKHPQLDWMGCVCGWMLVRIDYPRVNVVLTGIPF